MTIPIKPNRPILLSYARRKALPWPHTQPVEQDKNTVLRVSLVVKIHVLACVSPYSLQWFFFFFFFFPFPFISCFCFSVFSLPFPAFTTYIFPLSSWYCPFNPFIPPPLVFRFYSFLFHSFTLFVFVLTLCLVFFQIPLPLSLLHRPPVIVLKSLNINSDNDMEDPVSTREG